MFIILAILIFGFLIIIHELGHFTAAKLLGVKVNEFSICMGPAIFQKTVGETTYSLRCIPLGGYCAMEGEDELSDNPRAFTGAKWWKRLIILVAGAFMNFLLGAIIIFILLSSAQGFRTTEITSFLPGTLLEDNGLRVGDCFYSIDGERTYDNTDIPMLLDRSLTGTADVVVIRDGEKVRFPEFKVQRIEYEENGETQLLYGLTTGYVEADARTLLKYTWYNCLNYSRLVRMGLSDLISGRTNMSDMGGVVAIVHVMNETGKEAETTSEGLYNVFNLAAFIAINLAIMNMLPIPALDGGRVFFLLVTTLLEAILGRKIDPKYEGYIHAAGMVLLLGFMIFIMFHDVWMLIKG